MKRFGLMFGLALVAIACATGADMVGEMMDSGVPDAGAQPGTGATMKFVGGSTGTVSASGGLYGIYAACRETFGAGHRMCTLSEIQNTADLPSLAEGTYMHQLSLEQQSCRGWSSGGTSSDPTFVPGLDETGRFSTGAGRCSTQLFVACCGPK